MDRQRISRLRSTVTWRRVLFLCVLAALGAIGVVFAVRSRSSGPIALAPPGTFSTIADAKAAAGFDIPALRGDASWRIQQIEVATPDIGYGTDKQPRDEMRFVTVFYVSDGDRQFHLRVVKADGAVLQPVQGAGDSTNVRIAGKPAVLRQIKVAEARATVVTIQSLQGDLWVSVDAFLPDPIVVSGRTVRAGFTLDDLLPALEQIR
jgi:hypothetical protein